MLRRFLWPVLLGVLMLIGFSIASTGAMADCCQPPTRGNLDGSPDGLVSLGDLNVMIDILFISLEPPMCWSEGNLDGSLPEGPGSITLGDLTAMINHLYISLEPFPPCPLSGAPQGQLTNHSSCKSIEKSAALDDPRPTEGCLDWSYDGFGTLTIEHLNAGFNCCPVILADIEVVGNNIIVNQIDSLDGGGCSCLCLFDLTYEITNLQPGIYKISVFEPYLPEGDAPMEVTINLATEPTGRFCLPRSQYPWIEW